MAVSDPLALIWQQYGLWGFLGYVAVREIWPFVRDRVWPARVKKAHQEQERLNRMEERQIEAIEAMGTSVHEMALAISANNERLSALIAGFAAHSSDMSHAVTVMRERTGVPAKKRLKRSE